MVSTVDPEFLNHNLFSYKPCTELIYEVNRSQISSFFTSVSNRHIGQYEYGLLLGTFTFAATEVAISSTDEETFLSGGSHYICPGTCLITFWLQVWVWKWRVSKHGILLLQILKHVNISSSFVISGTSTSYWGMTTSNASALYLDGLNSLLQGQ